MSVDPTVKLVNGCIYIYFQSKVLFVTDLDGKSKTIERQCWILYLKEDGTEVVVTMKEKTSSFFQYKEVSKTWYFVISKVDEFVLNKTEKKEVNTPGLGLYIGFVSVVVLTWFMNKN
jgi:hypothetical protein